MKMNILVLHSYELLHSALRELNSNGSTCITKSVDSIVDVFNLLETGSYDVAVVDQETYPDATKRIKAYCPVIVVSGSKDDAAVRKAAKDGATDFVWIGAKLARLAQALNIAKEGSQSEMGLQHIAFLSNELDMYKRTVAASGVNLSARETEVLVRITEGKTNAEIAGELDTSPGYVKILCNRMYEKLGLPGGHGSRPAAAVWAVREGVV